MGKECGSVFSSRPWGGALRDETENGCVGDYSNSASTKYGQPDMEYFESLVRLPEIEAAFLLIQT